MILEIVTPEATLLHSEVELISVPGINGEFQMLNNHAPIVSLLVEGTIRFKGSNIKISEESHTKAKVISVLKGITLNEYFEKAIDDAITSDKSLLEKLKKQI